MLSLTIKGLNNREKYDICPEALLRLEHLNLICDFPIGILRHCFDIEFEFGHCVLKACWKAVETF